MKRSRIDETRRARHGERESADPENGEPRGSPQDSVAQIETISPDPLNEV